MSVRDSHAVDTGPERRLLAVRPRRRLYMPAMMDPIYGYQAINVEAQERAAGSLLQWTRHMIEIRKRTEPLRDSAARGATSGCVQPQRVLALMSG